MKALIDLDILCYELGGAFENTDGVTVDDPDHPLVMQRVHGKIESIVHKVGADSWEGFLTDSPSNFRLKVATILPYKGHRKSEKPIFHWHIREALNKMPNVHMSEGQEADDDLGIYQYAAWASDDRDETIVCSRDKDLRMIPGYHYGWKMGNQKEFPVTYISLVDGYKNFYQQMLTGDTSDNIPGLYGVGPKSSLVKKVRDCDQPEDMEKIVLKAYEDRFGFYAGLFYNENWNLLWILREPLHLDTLEKTL